MHKLITVLLALVVLVTTSCNNDAATDNKILQYIPENTKIVISTDNLSDLSQFAKSNKLYKQLKALQRMQEIDKAAGFLRDHKLQDASLITLSLEGKNDVVLTLIAPAAEARFVGDSLKSTTSTINYNGNTIKKITSGSNPFYSITHKGFYLASSSQLVIESLVRREVKGYVFDKAFETIYSKTSNETLAIYVHANQANWLTSFLFNNNPKKGSLFADWYKLELINTSDFALELDGVLTYRDSTLQSQRFYNKLHAAPNKVQFIAPITAHYIKATSYNNPEQLLENLMVNNVKINGMLNDILTNSTELSEIGHSEERVLAFTLLPYESFFIDLESSSARATTYRDYTIFKLKNPLNGDLLQPMYSGGTLNYISLVGDYLLLGTTATSLEGIIANYESQAVYAKQAWWDDAMASMSSSSSLLHITSTSYLKDDTTQKSPADLAIIKNIDAGVYPAMISQYTHENEYAHYHLIIPKASKTTNVAVTTQLGTYKSNEAILAGPFLFPNHNTGRHDVAFQDASGNLNLITDDGTKLWDKKINGTIMGDVLVVDALKNNKFQMVFNTTQALYVLDRNGDPMPGFPITFKEPLTQPVNVFDYDNKRDYRLALTQGKNLLMYAITGKKVTGFNYTPGAVITTQPLHIKVNTDDYIAFAKADNSIAIISRTGSVRTKVKEQLILDGGLYEYKKTLGAKTTEGTLVSINLSSGAVNKTGSVPSEALYAASGSMQITTTNNKVLMNGQNVTIPFGIFENLQVTQLRDIPYAHFIESGEKKAYIVNKYSRVVESMPVFGTGKTALAQSKYRYLVTLDGNDIIIYKW